MLQNSAAQKHFNFYPLTESNLKNVLRVYLQFFRFQCVSYSTAPFQFFLLNCRVGYTFLYLFQLTTIEDGAKICCQSLHPTVVLVSLRVFFVCLCNLVDRSLNPSFLSHLRTPCQSLHKVGDFWIVCFGKSALLSSAGKGVSEDIHIQPVENFM